MIIKESRTLVTGAAGFIGSHLVEALHARGARVTALVHYDSRADLANLELIAPEVRSAVHVVSGDVEDPFFVASVTRGHDVVFHLAALIPIPHSYVAPASFVRANVYGTLNVLEACRTLGVRRLVNVSTSETYGTARYTPIDEAHPQQAQSPYAATKIGAEKLADSYYLSFGVPVTNVRPFNTYGPRQSARAVIPSIVSQALARNTIRLGSLDPVRDLTFVTDTAAGLIAIAEAEAAIGGTFNLGAGVGISVGDLARRALAIMGIEREIVTDEERVRPEKSEVLRLVCDASRARAMTGWCPAVTLDQGLERTIRFIEAHPHLFRPDVYAR